MFFSISSLVDISHNYDYYNLVMIELLKWIVHQPRSMTTTIVRIKNKPQILHHSDTVTTVNINTRGEKANPSNDTQWIAVSQSKGHGCGLDTNTANCKFQSTSNVEVNLPRSHKKYTWRFCGQYVRDYESIHRTLDIHMGDNRKGSL